LVAAGLLVGGAPAAQAICHNVCEISHEAVTIVPPLDCARIRPINKTCECGLQLEISNDCPETLQTVDFAFHICGRPGSSIDEHARNCTSLPAGHRGVTDIDLPEAEGTGRKDKRLVLRAQDGDHTIVAPIKIHLLRRGAGM